MKCLSFYLPNWHSAESDWANGFGQGIKPDNFFAQGVLGVQYGEKTKLLPSLHTLALSGVSFQSMEVEMTYALNVVRLHTLKLWNCPGSLGLLQVIIDSGQVVRLKSLELTSCCFSYRHEPVDRAAEIVAGFLRGFQGLEDIYLMLPQPIDWGLVVHGLLSHQSTLKRLITHDLVEPAFAIFTDGDIPWTDQCGRLFQGRSLACFGTCMQLPVLVGLCIFNAALLLLIAD
jgi:hypothetical protein